MKGYGLTHIYTGDGKGKTTAAMGLILRALGREAKVLLVQFMKTGESGEIMALSAFPHLKILRAGEKLGFSFRLDEEGKRKLKAQSQDLLAAAAGEAAAYDLLVLDEAVSAYRLGYLDREALLAFLNTKPEALEVVLTGRDAPEELLALADYVSEIQKVKHPFDGGLAARKGIEK